MGNGLSMNSSSSSGYSPVLSLTSYDQALKRLYIHQRQQQQHQQQLLQGISDTSNAEGNGDYTNNNIKDVDLNQQRQLGILKKQKQGRNSRDMQMKYIAKLEDTYKRLAYLCNIHQLRTNAMTNEKTNSQSVNSDIYAPGGGNNSSNGTGITEAGFVELGMKEVIPNMPSVLSSRMYRAFSGYTSIVSNTLGSQTILKPRVLFKDDFISLLIILIFSTFEERILIAFTMMDQKKQGAITRDDMSLLLSLIHGSNTFEEMDPVAQLLSNELLEVVFPSNTNNINSPKKAVGFKEFGEHASKYLGASLFSWIPQIGESVKYPISLSSHRFDKAIEGLVLEFISTNNEIDEDNDIIDNTDEEELSQNKELFGIVKILKPTHEAALYRRYFKDPTPENLSLGEQWYLIHAKWFYYWSRYSGFKDRCIQKPSDVPTPDKSEGLPPGKIINQSLLEKTPNGLLRLRRNIKPFVDYWIMPAKCWLILSQWYGFDYSIFRSVVPDTTVTSSKTHTPIASSAPATNDDDSVEYAKIEGPLPPPKQKLRIEMYPLAMIVEYKPKRNVTETSTGLWNISKSVPWNWGSSGNSSNESSIVERNVLLSRGATLRDLRKQACQVHGIPNMLNTMSATNNIEYGHVQLYKVSKSLANIPEFQTGTSPTTTKQKGKNALNNLMMPLIKSDEDLLRTLEEIGIVDGDRLVIDLQIGEEDEDEENDKVGEGKSSSLASSTNNQKKKSTGTSSAGLIGLQNLGNTCFINSSIQCLSHTKMLKNYFVTGQYMNDINTASVNGSKGKLAEAFGSLLKELWTSNEFVIAPKNLKEALAAIDEQYNGYSQHDAQEMLARLLDCLSEDLNKVLKKPYVEQPDSAGRDDKVVAAEWWGNHLKRERSIISSLFTGQFKSSIHCLACNFDSSRFEPFMSLSLPLPETRVRMLTIILVPLKGKENIECAVRVPIISTVLDVKRQLRLLKFDNFESVTATTNFEEDWVSAKMSYDFSSIGEYIPDDKSVGLIDVDEVIYMFEQKTKITTDEDEFKIGERVVIKGLNSSNDKKDDGHLGVIIGRHSSSSTSNKSMDSLSALLNGNGNRKNNDDVESSAVVKSCWKYDIMYLTFPVSKDTMIPETSLQKLDASKQYVTFRVIQRQWVRNKYYFLNPYVPVNCGDSFCIRINPDITTSCDLYNAIDEHLEIKGKTFIDSKDGTSYHSPYQIRIVKLNSTSPSDFSCLKCHWTKACRGCPLSCNDTPLSVSSFMVSSICMIVVDWGISIPFEDENDIMNQCSKRKTTRHESIKECLEADNEPTTLSECFKTFTSSERMEGANECYCSQCKKFQPHLKNLSLWRAPPILIVHLKRFHHTELGGRKLTRLVDFPLDQLDLLPFTSPTSDQIKSKYKLYAVINHSGNLGGGHYTAIIRQPYTASGSSNASENSEDYNNNSPSLSSNSKWTYFDDGRVIPCPIDVVSKHAYILFYINEDYENAEYADM